MNCPHCGYAEDSRSSDQNRRLHAMLNDLAKQVKWHGQKLPAGVWKRLCVAAWMREEAEENGLRWGPILIPALDGIGVDVIYERTSKLSVKRCGSLMEWIAAFGAEQNVCWSDPNYLSQMREYAA